MGRVKTELMIILHNDSFMEELDATVCAAAAVTCCTMIGCLAAITMVERIDDYTAYSNYQGKLIGGVI